MLIEDLAPGVPRDERGWYHFPRDVEERRQLFPQAVMDHPAKMQLGLTKAVIEAYTKLRDTVLDPFAGTGTTAVAAHLGRLVWLIELEQTYIDLIKQMKQMWENLPIILNPGDCRQILPTYPENAFQLVLTSPPYPHFSMKATEGIIAERSIGAKGVEVYKGGPMNLSRISNRFLFNRLMKQVYTEIYRVLKPGGFYVSVTKDSIRGKDRILLSAEIIRTVQESKLIFTGDWFKWKTPVALGNTINRSRGTLIVEDEDVIVFQKEK